MAAGEPFTDGQVRELSRAVQVARTETGVWFSVFVGAPEGPPREYAERLHAALGERAPHAVLILVCPAERRVEIVSGSAVSDRVTDRSCALAALSMCTAFGGGDLVGGIVTGLRMLTEAAGQLRAIAGEAAAS